MNRPYPRALMVEPGRKEVETFTSHAQKSGVTEGVSSGRTYVKYRLWGLCWVKSIQFLKINFMSRSTIHFFQGRELHEYQLLGR